MKKLFFIICFSVLNDVAFSQTTIIDHVLDSIINHTVQGRPQFIQINHGVVVDTLAIKKVSLHKKDSSILVKFSNNKTKKIKAVELWGQVTDFGERRRFYKGKSYVIWRTNAPYVYRVQKNNNFISYYSESLTSDIYLLNRINIEAQLFDSLTKNILIAHIPDQPVSIEFAINTSGNNTSPKASNTNGLLKDIAETTVDITATLFETLLAILNNQLFAEIINALGK